MARSQMTGIFLTSSMLKYTHKVRLWVKRSKHKNDQMERWNAEKLNQYFTLVLQSLFSWAGRSTTFFLILHKTSMPRFWAFFFLFRLSWRCHSFLPNKYLWVMHMLTPSSAILIYRLCSCIWKCSAAPSWQAVQLPSGTAPWTALRLDSFQQL